MFITNLILEKLEQDYTQMSQYCIPEAAILVRVYDQQLFQKETEEDQLPYIRKICELIEMLSLYNQQRLRELIDKVVGLTINGQINYADIAKIINDFDKNTLEAWVIRLSKKIKGEPISVDDLMHYFLDHRAACDYAVRWKVMCGEITSNDNRRFTIDNFGIANPNPIHLFLNWRISGAIYTLCQRHKNDRPELFDCESRQKNHQPQEALVIA
jgi:hypothetical protein